MIKELASAETKKSQEWSCMSKFGKLDGNAKLLSTNLNAEDCRLAGQGYVMWLRRPKDLKPWEDVLGDDRDYKCFPDYMHVNFITPERITRICHSHVIFMPLVWSDNESFELKVLSDLVFQVTIARDYELFNEHLHVSSWLGAKQKSY